MLVAYVDYMSIVGKYEEVQELVAKRIEVQVQLRVKESFTKVFGMCVEHDKTARVLQISSYPLIDSTVSRFGLSDTKPVATLMASVVRIELNGMDEPFEGP